MEIELGIRNVAGAVTFNTDEPADQVGSARTRAYNAHTTTARSNNHGNRIGNPQRRRRRHLQHR